MGNDYARVYDEAGTTTCDIVVSTGRGRHHDGSSATTGACAHPLLAMPANARVPVAEPQEGSAAGLEDAVAHELEELGVDGLT